MSGFIFVSIAACIFCMTSGSPSPQRNRYYSTAGVRAIPATVSSTYAPPTVNTIYSDATVSEAGVNEVPASNSAAAQQQQVKILKQINKLNDDGSYTFGYEAADGSFKVETRDNLGNVKGKFGFVDATGELKTVEYTAGNGTGFAATGDFIPPSAGATQTVAQPAEQHYTQRSPSPQYQSQYNTRGRQVQASPSPAPQYYTPSTPAPQTYQFPQQFTGFASGIDGGDGQINYELDGFSEDVDQDGFVDPVPHGGSSSGSRRPSHQPQAVVIPKGSPSPAPAIYQQYNIGQQDEGNRGFSLPQYHQQQAQGGHAANDGSNFFAGTPFNFPSGSPVEVQVFPGPPPKPVQPIHPQQNKAQTPTIPQRQHTPQQYNIQSLGDIKPYEGTFSDFSNNGIGSGSGLESGFGGGNLGGGRRPFQFGAGAFPGPLRPFTSDAPFAGGFGGSRGGSPYQGINLGSSQGLRIPSQQGLNLGSPQVFRQQGSPGQFQFASPGAGQQIQGFPFQSLGDGQPNNFPQSSQPVPFRQFPFQARHATDDARDPRISNRPF